MTGAQLTEKTLDVLDVFAGQTSVSLARIQEACGLPLTTAHRIVQALIRRGYVVRSGRGQYQLGPAVLALSAGVSRLGLLSVAARPILAAMSRKLRAHAHLGVWEEGMVTYLVKQPFGKTRIHSAEGMQLEAYCSALGKVLLAGMVEDQCTAYLAEGGFVPLTSKTITEPADLRHEIDAVREKGWASDDEESAPGLYCLAVPVKDQGGAVIAAISVSRSIRRHRAADDAAVLAALQQAAQSLSVVAPSCGWGAGPVLA